MKKILSLAVWMFSACFGFAQNSAVRGGIGGIVTDPSGAAVSNAKVTITGSQGTTNLTSDENGREEATGFTPGLYTGTVTGPGFSKFVLKAHDVTIHHSADFEPSLSVGNE